MTPKRNRPPWGEGGAVRDCDLSGRRIGSETIPSPTKLQVIRIKRIFGLAEPLAHTVARLAFGEVVV